MKAKMILYFILERARNSISEQEKATRSVAHKCVVHKASKLTEKTQTVHKAAAFSAEACRKLQEMKRKSSGTLRLL